MSETLPASPLWVYRYVKNDQLEGQTPYSHRFVTGASNLSQR